MAQKKVGNVIITSKDTGNRIYFSGDGGNACWNKIERAWVKVRKEFGWRFKAQIKQVFSL